MRTLALRRIFFLGVMGWGDGDIQVSRRRRRRSSEAPGSSPRLPEGAKSETPLGRFGPRGTDIELLCMFFQQILDEFVPLPNEIDFAAGHFPHDRFIP